MGASLPAKVKKGKAVNFIFCCLWQPIRYQHIQKTFMRKQVAILEDNPNIRELIQYILEDNEIDVIGFESAADFLSALAEISPNLFILDIMLPDGNGIDICRQLKSNEATRETPIVMISAHFNEFPLDCDAADFIEKPFDIDHFLSRVERQIA